MYTYYVNKLAPWLKNIIKTKESGTIVGLPGSAKNRSIQNTFTLLNKNEIYQIVDLSLPEESDQYLKDKIKEYQLEDIQYILLSGFDFNNPSHLRKLNLFHSARQQSKYKINYIYICHQDPFLYSNTIVKYAFSKKIFANILYLPYANRQTYNSVLLPENQARFNTRIPNNLLEPIWKLSGGCPFLVKNIVKFYAENKNINNLDKHPNFIPLLNHLVSKFDIATITYLKNNKKNQPIQKSLLNLGLLNQTNKTIKSILIKKHIQTIKLFSPININIANQKIYLNNLDITGQFLPKEKNIILSLKQSGQLSRQQIGQICFKMDEQYSYSEYSIDKTMSRLRKKLQKLGIDPQIIKTQKRIGYSLNIK